MPRLLKLAGLAGPVLLGLLLGGCNRRPDQGPVVVSAIGGAPELIDPARRPLDTPSRLLRDATAQGLVRFDAQGRVAPGLAERWTVLDDGASYVFRLREAEWPDGKRVTAGDVVAALDRQRAEGSRNPLAPYLTAIDEIVEMTPQVIEVRLKRPRPDLLNLFAQPELGIARQRPPGGSGPYRAKPALGGFVLLKPVPDPVRVAEGDVPSPEENVLLTGERAARALARFRAGRSDLVAGGSFLDLPIARVAGIAPANFRLDLPAGLFGLAIVSREGFLSEAANRAALAEAIDRAALTAAFADDWAPAEQILPDRLDSANPPAIPSWAVTDATARRAEARARVATWRKAHGGAAPVLRVALPQGPGANLLFGFVGASLRAIGVDLVRVPADAEAELRLIDAVAPYDSARWYLTTACPVTSDAAAAKLIDARDANDMSTRGVMLAEADGLIAADQCYIPIARPLRWAAVSLRLARWQGNARGWHPLNELRRDTR
ncbi:MAG: ABC transporter substrate-binding protein [Proteobacteria bacterium SG_bin5]|nr:MAG: ABC transporter substrate-binding protein [Proteobacteria bacterium SG_bin5]